MNELRLEIIKRFGSVHAFAKLRPGGLGRSTIYQVLNGQYSGDVEKIGAQLKAALNLADESGPIFKILKEIACASCHRKPSARRRACRKCFELWEAQAKALTAGFLGSHPKPCQGTGPGPIKAL